MAKLQTYLGILIFVDILFIITGQLNLDSNLSIVTGAILNPSAFKSSIFFLLFLGTVGIAGLVAKSGVTTGLLFSATNVLAFTAMAIAMIGLLGDYISIFITLNAHNTVLATVIMAPLIMLFSVTLAEWLRGRD